MVKIYNFLCTEAKTIREKVFMEEQGFKNEFDEYDEMVPHAVLFMDCLLYTSYITINVQTSPLIKQEKFELLF